MTNIAPKKRGPAPSKSPAIGRAPPGDGTNIDDVSACRIWKEHCEKVEALIQQPGEFALNPFTTLYMCQPPTNFWPSIHISEEELATYKRWLEKYSMIKDIDKTPPAKYELPQTINQEYGWISTPLVEKNPLFNYDNNSCEITQYAAHYYALMHTTPFSQKKPITNLMSSLKVPLPKPPGGGGGEGAKVSNPAQTTAPPAASTPAQPATSTLAPALPTVPPMASPS